MTEWAFCKRGSVKHDENSWVRIILYIKDNITGKVVKRHTETIWQPELQDMLFIWTEGNFSCDCNRRIFYEGYSEDSHYQCGMSEYSINIMNPENGQWIYREFPVEEAIPPKKKYPMPKSPGRPPKKKTPEEKALSEVTQPLVDQIKVSMKAKKKQEKTLGLDKIKKKRGRPPKAKKEEKVTPPVEKADPKDEEMSKDEQQETKKDTDYQVPTVSEETKPDTVS